MKPRTEMEISERVSSSSKDLTIKKFATSMSIKIQNLLNVLSSPEPHQLIHQWLEEKYKFLQLEILTKKVRDFNFQINFLYKRIKYSLQIRLAKEDLILCKMQRMSFKVLQVATELRDSQLKEFGRTSLQIPTPIKEFVA